MSVIREYLEAAGLKPSITIVDEDYKIPAYYIRTSIDIWFHRHELKWYKDIFYRHEGNRDLIIVVRKTGHTLNQVATKEEQDEIFQRS